MILASEPHEPVLPGPNLLEGLAALAQAVGAADEPLVVYRALGAFIESAAPCCGIFVADYDPVRLERECAYTVSEGIEEDASALPRLPAGDGPQGRAIRTGRPVVTDDYEAAVANIRYVDLGVERDPNPPRSSIAVPMVARGAVVGVLEAQSTVLAAYGPAHVTAMQLAANLAAVALDNVASLERERAARATAEASEERYRTLVANVPGIVYRCADDPDWTMDYLSDGVLELTGYPAADLVGNRLLSWASLVHPEDRDRVAIEVAAAAGSFVLDYRVTRADGAERWVREWGRRVQAGEDGRAWLDGVIIDTTESRRSENTRRRLSNFSRAAASSLELEQVLERTLAAVEEEVAFASAAFLFPEPGGRTLRNRALRASWWLAARGPLSTPLDASIVGAVFESGEAELVNDAQLDPRSFFPAGAVVEREHLIAAPLAAGGERLGVLVIAREHDPPFEPRSLEIVQALAATASVAIRNALLFERAREAEALERDRNAVLESIARGEPLGASLARTVELVEGQRSRALGALLVPSKDGTLVLVSGPSLPEPLARALAADVEPADEGFPGAVAARAAGLVACRSSALVGADGAALGTLAVYHPDPAELAATDGRLLASAGRLAAIAIERDAQLERYLKLAELTADLEVIRDPIDVVREALRRCLELTPFGCAAYAAVTGDAVEPLVFEGRWPLEAREAAGAIRTLGELGPVRETLLRHEPYFREESPERTGPAGRRAWAAVAILPVFARGALMGLLCFASPERPVRLGPEARRLLEGVAERVSNALERTLDLSDLAASREETLRALGLALEYRDYESKGHTDRVVGLTERLAREVGIGGPDLDALRWGAYLHDTGKVAIPDGVLLKPGKPTPEEWEQIKRHPSTGFQMLCNIPSLPPATLEVVLHHHERWDGSGYPASLGGPGIPLSARLFALPDVFDALTSERPYKRAWSVNEALAEIERTSGSHFDPRLASAFVSMIRRDAPAVPSGPKEAPA